MHDLCVAELFHSAGYRDCDECGGPPKDVLLRGIVLRTVIDKNHHRSPIIYTS